MDYQTKFKNHVMELSRCAMTDFDTAAMHAYLCHFMKDRSGFAALRDLLELAAENPAVAAYLTWREAYGFTESCEWEGDAEQKADLKRGRERISENAW